MKCGYLEAARRSRSIRQRACSNPAIDPLIVGADGHLHRRGVQHGGTDGNEFRKTASVMKLVIDGFAGAGCITMGGYDYHGGMRQEGEIKDFRAGRCMGAMPRVRRAHGQCRDDVCVQRRLAVEQRRDRQLRRRPRQGRVDERQPGHGGAVLPRLQPATEAAARSCFTAPTADGRATSTARRLLRRRRRRALRHPGREQRQPARARWCC